VELLIAFGISTVILGVIWYFFLGFQNFGERGKSKLELNQVSEIGMETFIRDLRMADQVLELKRDRIRFERAAPPENLPYQHLAFSSRVVETVEYYMTNKERDNRYHFRKVVGLGLPEDVFVVDTASDEVFEGLVMQPLPSLGEIKKGGDDVAWPTFKPYDVLGGSSGDLRRVVLVRVTFDLGLKKDRIALTSKVFLPTVYQGIVQKDWNPD